MSQLHTCRVWINAPSTSLTELVEHYLQCQQAAPADTTACVVVNLCLTGSDRLTGMTLIKKHNRDSVISDTACLCPLVRYVTPCTAVVRQHSQTCVAQAAVTDQPLTMLFEGTIHGIQCCNLLDSRASANFISDAAIERLGLVIAPTQASLELADGNTLSILGKVKVKLKMGAFQKNHMGGLQECGHG